MFYSGEYFFIELFKNFILTMYSKGSFDLLRQKFYLNLSLTITNQIYCVLKKKNQIILYCPKILECSLYLMKAKCHYLSKTINKK